jgi:hypothetical protein
MRTYGRGLTLNVVAYLRVSLHPATAQQAPPDYGLLTNPRMRGAEFVHSRPGSGRATASATGVPASAGGAP